MGRAKPVEKENVLIQTDRCSVAILPRFGGKIASIRIDDKELLQAPLVGYGPRTRTMSFETGDASGWDECLPSVAPCSVETAGGIARIPDHGDLWRVQWSRVKSRASSRTASWQGECFSLPLTLKRTIDLAESGDIWNLQLRYQISNRGSFPVPWAWAAHPLFAVEEGDHIHLPVSIKNMRLEGSNGGRLGKAGDTVSWPETELANGGRSDLSAVQAATTGIGDKLFAGPLRVDENWCSLERPKAGISIRLRFNSSATPYLGLWLCYGGWPERPGLKQMCVALEPSTAPVDSLAESGIWSRMLQANETYSWPITVEFETI
jgi:galactose mutarotase-like enzyme